MSNVLWYDINPTDPKVPWATLDEPYVYKNAILLIIFDRYELVGSVPNNAPLV